MIFPVDKTRVIFRGDHGARMHKQRNRLRAFRTGGAVDPDSDRELAFNRLLVECQHCDLCPSVGRLRLHNVCWNCGHAIAQEEPLLAARFLLRLDNPDYKHILKMLEECPYA